MLYFIIVDDFISGGLESDIIIKAQVQAFLAQEFELIEQLVVVKANDHEIDTWVINKEGFLEDSSYTKSLTR